jgi:hypothetical protein
MFEPALKALAHRGRQIEIASVGDRRVSFDLVDFYHNESRLFGVDTRQRDATASAALLEALTPFFDDATFQPPMIDRVIPLPRDVRPTSRWLVETERPGCPGAVTRGGLSPSNATCVRFKLAEPRVHRSLSCLS